ncbi:hypothetical protein [Streptomyces sp. NPDC086838]|uniref:hypothetical protein n=1 Tax=Streptomyces sp. NPDC086838 TaxID=3365762 RepID=UPI00380CB262
MTDQPTPADNRSCPNCKHSQHLPGTECEAGVDHGPKRWHRCLCLARPGAALACPPQMNCQGGTLGYADVWYLQHGHTLMSNDGAVSPEALKTSPAAVRQAADAPAVAPTAPPAACPECGDTGACNGGPCPLLDRHERYVAAILDALARDTSRGPNWGAAATAVMAVADAEVVQAMRAMHDTKEEEAARLRAEVERLRTNRATEPVCICGHPEAQHIEDVCQTCGCGDYLEPQDAAHVIDRWRKAALAQRDARRATVLRELADVAETLRQFEPAYGPRKDAQVSENVGVLRVADHFRRLADEAQQHAVVPCMRPMPHPAHSHSGFRKGDVVHGRCPGVEAQQPETEATATEEHRVVGYRWPHGTFLYCTRHAYDPALPCTPLTSDDLPDGGVCSWCGTDVLIPAPTEEPTR